jgi:glycosyltransferase involved in cell wall biosynthesis
MAMKNKVTIVVPARHELYLEQTIKDILTKATGDIEVILVLDNYWPAPMIPDDPRVTIVHWGGRRGLRAAINAAADIGKGEYLLKADAHILFDEGFDEKLKADCEPDWCVIPRRYALDADAWRVKPDRPAVDYMYLGFPSIDENKQLGMHGRNWLERGRERSDPTYDIDETMSFQGSLWFMPMKYFMDLIYPMDDENYGMFIGEPQEIAMKVWLSGGRVMVNKKTWYAHLWKGQPYREKFREQFGFSYSRIGLKERAKGNAFSLDYWFFNRWEARRHDLAWLVERFYPVPTWSEDREQWTILP